MIDHKKMKDALKIVNEVPKSVERAEKLYQERLAEIKTREATGDWGRNKIAADRQSAKEDRDRVVSRLMGQFESAVVTIKENNSFGGALADFADPKFQAALSFIGTVGHDMSPSDQIGLLEQFKGQPGQLNALGAVMKKHNMFFSNRAQELTKTISNQALEDATYVIGLYKYNGKVDFGRMRWTKDEFDKFGERNGYDMEDAPDPYLAALSDARNNISISDDPMEEARNKAKRMKIDLAIQDVKKAVVNGNVEEVFTKAVRGIEGAAAEGNA